MQERRKWQRIKKPLKAQFYLTDDIARIVVDVLNISAGGMKVLSPFPIDNRYIFPMTIFLTEEFSIDVSCRVVWKIASKVHKGFYEMGLHFVEIKEKDREILDTLVADWKKTYE